MGVLLKGILVAAMLAYSARHPQSRAALLPLDGSLPGVESPQQHPRRTALMIPSFLQEDPRQAFASWVQSLEKAYKDNVEVLT